MLRVGQKRKQQELGLSGSNTTLAARSAVLVLAAQVDGSAFRCESVLPPQAATVDTNEGRLF